ncbi:MAG: hypothetical protein E7382_04430 [Clostridiales bacterium]|nr:hypothetical protein [Clostridiales bacterium]
MFSQIIAQLNSLINECLNGEKQSEQTLFFGDALTSSVNLCTKIAPQGKVLLITTAKTFDDKGKQLADALVAVGNKPVTIVMEEDFSLSVDKVCGTFNAPEDVRAVVCVDYSLFDTALYFSAIRNLPLVQTLFVFNPKRLLSKTLLVKNGEDVDEFLVNVKRYVVIDEGALNDDTIKARLFAYASSKIVSLTDYRVMGTVMREPLNVKAFNLARKALLDTFKVLAGAHLRKEELFYNAMVLEIADAMTDDKLLSFSTPSLAEFIYYGKFKGDSGVELLTACSVLECYKTYFSGDYDHVVIPTEYSKRAKLLCESCGFLEESILNAYKKQGNRFAMRKVKIAKLKNQLLVETEKVNKLAGKLIDKYVELGGNKDYDLDKLSLAINLSGDTPLSINTMSLIREEGLIQSI